MAWSQDVYTIQFDTNMHDHWFQRIIMRVARWSSPCKAAITHLSLRGVNHLNPSRNKTKRQDLKGTWRAGGCTQAGDDVERDARRRSHSGLGTRHARHGPRCRLQATNVQDGLKFRQKLIKLVGSGFADSSKIDRLNLIFFKKKLEIKII
jgi:hypothetical protein